MSERMLHMRCIFSELMLHTEMSECMLHMKISCVVSELMLHTKMCNAEPMLQTKSKNVIYPSVLCYI